MSRQLKDYTNDNMVEEKEKSFQLELTFTWKNITDQNPRKNL